MDVMMIFNVVMMILGIYMIISAFNMKKNRQIGMILAEEEINKCKDTAGFIEAIYRQQAVMGVTVILYGGIELLDNYVLGVGGLLNYIPKVLVLVVFLWFYKGLQSARTEYLY